jgi:sugar phosphate isomerase/epimerase
MPRRSARSMIVASLLAIGLGSPLLAAEPGPQEAGWKPKLYGFCVEQSDAKKRALPEQVAMLRELGFDGVGYPLWFGETLDKNLKTIDDSGLTLYMVWTTINVNPAQKPYDPRLPEALAKLKGRPVVLSVLLSGYKPGDPEGMEPAVKVLREVGDMAAAVGLKVSIYNHLSNWVESVLHSVEVVKRVDHPAVGANFNLCHWLKVDSPHDYQPVLRENAAKIFAVTINGAKVGGSNWAELIQPLDQGDFDVPKFLATLREAGYRGPIALMAFGIPGDAREHLQRSITTWKKWTATP